MFYKKTKLYRKIKCHHTWAIREFLENFEKSLPDNTVVLDAGAGQCQYKDIFVKRHKYIAQDLCVGDAHWDFSSIDIKSNIDDIPLPDEHVDIILLNQVLEHVYNPKEVIKELSRILKGGGKLVITVPQCDGEHQIPYDFFRYTRYSLEKLAQDNGLVLDYIKPQGGYFILLALLMQELPYILFGKDEKGIGRRIFIELYNPFAILIGIFGILLDGFDKNKRMTSNYECIMIKK